MRPVGSHDDDIITRSENHHTDHSPAFGDEATEGTSEISRLDTGLVDRFVPVNENIPEAELVGQALSKLLLGRTLAHDTASMEINLLLVHRRGLLGRRARNSLQHLLKHLNPTDLRQEGLSDD